MTVEEMLNGQYRARVVETLNILLEAPYFYKTDDEETFAFLRRHASEFRAWFRHRFEWDLFIDAKCARLYKDSWFNAAVTPSNRDLFTFTRRDDCIAFMLVLEFFEQSVERDGVSLDEPENYKFRFGDLFDFEKRRFRELFPAGGDSYSDDSVRKILRGVMPQLERYRFLRREEVPADMNPGAEEIIYECLPALWHYRSEKLVLPVKAAEDAVAEGGAQ